VGIVIVNNMLLTGFDAPIEQVMYLDQVIKAHNLLQAIARVNRLSGLDKDKGYVIDYVGIGHHLQEAISNYYEREQKEVQETLSFPEDEQRQLETDYNAIVELLAKYGLEDWNDYEAFYDLFYDEDIRFEFVLAFRKFTRSLNALYPAKEALAYLNEYKALVEINVQAQRHFRDQRLSMKGIPEKLRQLTDAHLVSKGIDSKIKPISILDDEFQDQIENSYTRTSTKAAAVEHAIREHIDIELDDDPELQASFAEALAQLLEEFKDNWDQIYQELEKLRDRLKNAANEPTYGLHKKKEMPFFRMFKRECFGEDSLDDDTINHCVALTREVFTLVERELQLKGFWESIPARNKLKAEIQKVLLSPEFKDIPNIIPNRKQIISRVMELAERNNDLILYAE